MGLRWSLGLWPMLHGAPRWRSGLASTSWLVLSGPSSGPPAQSPWKRVGGLPRVSKVVACCWDPPLGLGPQPLPYQAGLASSIAFPQEVGVKWGTRGPAPQL